MAAGRTSQELIVVCAAGLKGARFVEGLIARGITPATVFSYPQADDAADGFGRIQQVAASAGVDLVEAQRPEPSSSSLVFMVGWQYLLARQTGSTVVFHDSLLPRYRGFAPTVSALLNGDAEIGVTALLAAAEMDAGPVIAQASVPISYPMPIGRALELQTDLMIDLAERIYRMWLGDGITATAQDHAKATYSLWRDELDYLIDWSDSAEAIARFVDAVGYPYAGARTHTGAESVIVLKARALPDLAFERRQCGKVWKIEEGRPQVVCGSGLLLIEECRTVDGEPLAFRKLRTRLRSAAPA